MQKKQIKTLTTKALHQITGGGTQMPVEHIRNAKSDGVIIIINDPPAPHLREINDPIVR